MPVKLPLQCPQMPSNNNSVGHPTKQKKSTQTFSSLEAIHCCYLRASVGIGMAILPLEGIYPQIKRTKVLFKSKTNNLPLICNSIFETGRQCLLDLRAVPSK
jgi:hypothetical protein